MSSTIGVRSSAPGSPRWGAGVKCVKPPTRSPDLNADAERFVRSTKSECLHEVVPLGDRHLRVAIGEHVERSHQERSRQGFGNRLLRSAREGEPVDDNLPVIRRERLCGPLSFHHRARGVETSSWWWASDVGSPLRRCLGRRPISPEAALGVRGSPSSCSR